MKPILLPGDEMRDLEMVPDSMLHSSADRPAFIDRLANSITKRKRSTPQKFIGKVHFKHFWEKGWCSCEPVQDVLGASPWTKEVPCVVLFSISIICLILIIDLPSDTRRNL